MLMIYLFVLLSIPHANEGRERISFWSWNQTLDLVNHLCKTLLNTHKMPAKNYTHPRNGRSSNQFGCLKRHSMCSQLLEMLQPNFSLCHQNVTVRLWNFIALSIFSQPPWTSSWFFAAQITVSFFVGTVSFEALMRQPRAKKKKKCK